MRRAVESWRPVVSICRRGDGAERGNSAMETVEECRKFSKSLAQLLLVEIETGGVVEDMESRRKKKNCWESRWETL